MDLRYIPDSGFMARGQARPRRDNVRDWLVWHFTHVENVPSIAEAGILLPTAKVRPPRSVANDEVKGRRIFTVAPDPSYPAATVSDHVPSYVAAKSPMLYAVTTPGPGNFKARSADLVFFSVVIGDLIDAGLTWCVSNGNAASS
ncbi:hypothetical protein J2S43_005279 [Catenuloplanes nepalensis]|uniref:DarT domain-containing protein n=1 Tax=Catenuloplanes nepalensis TaxID=587533 RepID=A0ABT9MZ95_9ACTN|nr:hypothetical protein [Catenuloplanes nepalensis]